jgi:folate-binding protein YgfZ
LLQIRQRSAQGRILADLYVYQRGEYLLVDTDRSQVPRLLEIFDRYIIMDDVEISDAGEKLAAIAVQGPKAREVLSRAGLPCADPQPLQVADAMWQGFGVSVTRMASEVSETFEILLAAANAAAAWKALLAAGARPAASEAVEMFRVAAGIPRYGLDIRERDLPQETEQNQALNFHKGCYIGQEIVERIHARGAVHRKFSGFVVEGGKPELGTKIVAGAKEIGELTSVLPVAGKVLALGYIRREAASPGAEVQVNGNKARVATLPFKEIQ